MVRLSHLVGRRWGINDSDVEFFNLFLKSWILMHDEEGENFQCMLL